MELTCKLKNETIINSLEDLKNHQLNWQDVLTNEQLNVLSNCKLEALDLRLHGTLNNQRYIIKSSDFSEITIDLVTLSSDPNITFHEVSVRYPYKDLEFFSKKFENIVKNSGAKTCLNQKDWDINKFKVMTAY